VNAGLSAIPADNAIMPGINAVNERLQDTGDGRVRLQFYSGACEEVDQSLVEEKQPTCAIEEFDSYIWPTPRPGMASREKPIDEYNHGMDTLRYAVMYADAPRGHFAPLDGDLSGFFRRAGVRLR
jgi:hypothetical protein